jgi:hypothetical protein
VTAVLSLCEPGGDDRGFLALDALIGLLVVALGLVAVIEAQSHVQQLGRAALDLRLATAEAEYRLETEWPKLGRPGSLVGQRERGGATWSLTAVAARPLVHSSLAVCRVEAIASLAGSQRRATIDTERLCVAGA